MHMYMYAGMRGSLGTPPFNKTVPPFEGSHYHEILSLVYITFLEPSFSWNNGYIK